MTPRRPNLRPSGSKRWLTCTASAGLIARLEIVGEDEGSPYANEGTLAHECAAACLRHGFDESYFEGNLEMASYVKGYVDFIQKKVKPETTLFVEQEMPIFYDVETRGTTDAAVVHNDGSKVFIGDLKYGAGVSVQARDNTQLAIYALSLVRSMEYEFTPKTLVTICIYQPRIAEEEPVRLWALTLEELETFCAEIQATATSILADPVEQDYVPSDSTCQFCPASAVCAARAAYLLGELPREANPLRVEGEELADPEQLSLAELARIVASRKHIAKWLTDCEEYAAKLLMEGKPFPGHKLVAGRGVRKWIDDEAVVEKFLRGMFRRHEIYTEKLVSPTQAEKLMKAKGNVRKSSWAKFEDHMAKTTGGPTLASIDDPRPALNEQAVPEEEFQQSAEGEDLL